MNIYSSIDLSWVFRLAGNAGTAWQVLASQGSAAPPKWINNTATFYLPVSQKAVDPVSTTSVLPPLRLPWPGQVVSVDLNSETAPSVNPFIIDIKIDGTSIFSTRPQINIGATSNSAAPVFLATSFASGAILTVDITQASGGCRNCAVRVNVVQTGE
jgi:hypothetical protein